MKRAAVPNLLTLANAGLGLLAISKAIDALALGVTAPGFQDLLESACWLIVLAMVFDALDGRVARMLQTSSDLGAQLDSFADAITFGVAPAMVSKVMLEAHGLFHPRLNFFAAAAFSLMAVLRLARFNLETDHDEESHQGFRGLPSPAAAGILVATLLMTLSLGGGIEGTGPEATAVGKGLEVLPEAFRTDLALVLRHVVFFLLPLLGLSMVSRVPYTHVFSSLMRQRGRRGMARVVFLVLVLYLAPVPALFVAGYGYLLHGLWNAYVQRRESGDDSGDADGGDEGRHVA